MTTGPIDVKHRVNHDQLYAQTQELLRQGGCYLDEEQTRLVMKSNLQFRLELPKEQLFHEFFHSCHQRSGGQRMTVAAIFQEMKSKVGSGLRIANICTFGRFLSNLDSLTRRCRRYVTEYLVAKR